MIDPRWKSDNSRSRSFFILDQGSLEEYDGYWVEDDENGEVGFLEEEADVFWLFDEDQGLFVRRRFKGRTLRRGKSKGKGKG